MSMGQSIRSLAPAALLATLTLLSGASCVLGQQSTTPDVRWISDFRDAEGNSPNGLDDGADDTPALLAALAAGPGVVRIGPGQFRLGNVLVPSGVTLLGSGPATIIRSNGAKLIFAQRGGRDWAIRDMVLDGQARGPWRQRADEGFGAILLEQCCHYDVSGLSLRNFSGPALRVTRTGAEGTPITAGGRISHIVAEGNHTGVLLDRRGEYVILTELCCRNNLRGCVIHAGNITLANSSFISNVDGIVIRDKDNGSHGVVANCLSNHNTRHALWAADVLSGMVITGCCFFYGDILIENSTGVGITNGLLGCSVAVRGEGFNRIAGNRLFPAEGRSFDFGPTTIVEGNFGPEGPWSPSD